LGRPRPDRPDSHRAGHHHRPGDQPRLPPWPSPGPDRRGRLPAHPV